MKSYIHRTVLMICICLLAASCRRNMLNGEGAKTSSKPEVATFNNIEIDLPVKAVITVQQGAKQEITVNGYENIVKHITTKVTDNKLTITSDLDETWEVDCDGLTLQIAVPALAGLSLSGTADAELHGNISGSSFDLKTSGASKVTIDNINVTSFSSVLSGAGSLQVKGGNVNKAKYEISGAAKIVAFPMQTMETIATISGAAKAEVTAQEKLSATISGAGVIKYKGHPAVTKDISGAGSVAQAE